MGVLSNCGSRFSRIGVFLAVLFVCGLGQGVFAVPTRAQAPSVTEISKYLIVGFKKSPEGDAVNLQNGEFGADREVLSSGGSSSTGASFPNLQSVSNAAYFAEGAPPRGLPKAISATPVSASNPG